MTVVSDTKILPAPGTNQIAGFTGYRPLAHWGKNKVSYCTVPCARSSCYICSFLSSYWKRLKKFELDNKSLMRCFGVKYRRMFLLVVCILSCPAGSSKYSTTRKNIPRYFTPKHLIRYIDQNKDQYITLQSCQLSTTVSFRFLELTWWHF